ncbi:carbohydrate-binding family 9-like protein [Flagellimonas nanhaiensis]|uniref:Carbohydrate-binding family 9-like protein n=1 Tax=Flagellimonas nanhaiensis TaxID=2292706 RepID=A0A371JSX4_9FLAO|nr:carbohydrate-binding family 9-like protein [Allomuricauda nanhaiensis]RDY60859.1 carbohydrate-binding family 9-like protein [Allomuricauda nanhaiensis]
MLTRVIAFFFVLASFGQTNVPRSYVAHKVSSPIVVDGVDTNSEWQSVNWSQSFIDIEGVKKPLYETRIKMLWDESYFYLLAKMEEPHVWGNLKQRDTVIFYNNDFEVFIDPDGDTHNYYELEINSLNTQWDLFLTKPYRNGGKVLDSWDIQGLKTAVDVDGTINYSSDIDKGWTLEMAIPWSVITEAANHSGFPVNEFWRINFSRVNWQFSLEKGKYARKKDSNGKHLPEYNWVWSPQGVINMHEPEHWGYVVFSDKEPGQSTDFQIPKDEYVKWDMYGQYRNVLKDQNVALPKELNTLQVKIPLTLEKHTTGWNLWCISPFTGKKLIIDEDGKFTQE